MKTKPILNLTLERQYYAGGVNGLLSMGGTRLCRTIELPWKDNHKWISCIPEGRYRLVKRYSDRHGLHLQIEDVPGRGLILFHPFNDAQRESRGCIAPVMVASAPGVGLHSKLAMKKLTGLAFAAFQEGQQVYLTIQRAAKNYTQQLLTQKSLL